MSNTIKARDYTVWKLPEMAQKYLSGSRAAFPGAVLQIEVMLKIIKENSCNVINVLDIGCGDGILGATVLDEFPEARGVFLDFSDDMLAAAKNIMSHISHRIDLINYDYSDKSGWIKSATMHLMMSLFQVIQFIINLILVKKRYSMKFTHY